MQLNSCLPTKGINYYTSPTHHIGWQAVYRGSGTWPPRPHDVPLKRGYRRERHHSGVRDLRQPSPGFDRGQDCLQVRDDAGSRARAPVHRPCNVRQGRIPRVKWRPRDIRHGRPDLRDPGRAGMESQGRLTSRDSPRRVRAKLLRVHSGLAAHDGLCGGEHERPARTVGDHRAAGRGSCKG